MAVSSGMMLCPEHDMRIRDFSGLMKQPHSLPASFRWSRVEEEFDVDVGYGAGEVVDPSK